MAGLNDNYRTSVQKDWVDYNGHMRDGYFTVAFSSGIDAFMDHIGMDEAFRTRTGHTIYTLEAHVSYQMEAFEGQELSSDLLIVDRDAKRLHTFQTITLAETGAKLATQESMLMNVDQSGDHPKGAPFHPELEPVVEALWREHSGLERPAAIGRSIGIRRK